MVELFGNPFICYFFLRCNGVRLETTLFFIVFLLLDFINVLYSSTSTSTVGGSFEGFTSLHEICSFFSRN